MGMKKFIPTGLKLWPLPDILLLDPTRLKKCYIYLYPYQRQFIDMIFSFFKKNNLPIIRRILEGRFLFLVVSLLAYFALVPLLAEFLGARLLLDIFLTAVLVSGIYAVSPHKRQRLITASIAVPLLVAVWFYRLVQIDILEYVGQGFLLLFLAYSIACILSFIFRAPKVTPNVVYAAIAVYLFLGLLWSDLYMILETLQQGSFRFLEGQTNATMNDFSYFSFVTLTTLGYGDITPLTPKAKAFAMLEAVIGQLYLVVLVARLVGLQVAHSTKEAPPE